MPPEYKAYQISPHARVSCVECHIGRDVMSVVFTRKAGDLGHVLKYTTQQYETPIFAKTMRPARESCERCHWPEKFSNDSVREIKHYASDEKNTELRTFLIMRTGGGTAREGGGYGIHWHIENQVWYIATDEHKQNIPWVRVIDLQGRITDYVDTEAKLSPEFIAQAPKRLLDCIDCHNRISHSFRTPENAVDRAIRLKLIDRDLPFIKQKAVAVLSTRYASMEEAMKAVAALEGYYQSTYPQVYAARRPSIQKAIQVLKDTYQEMVFPNMKVSWDTHPDNIGHKDWPGCFRCHDGKHVSEQKTTIRLQCNICHSLPTRVSEGQNPPEMPVTTVVEPDSHLDSNWIYNHRLTFDATCHTCHDLRNAGGADNVSFCSNAACHGVTWKYAHLDAPGLVKLLGPAKAPAKGVATNIPHPTTGPANCAICHAQGKVRAAPTDHAAFDIAVCQTCHKPSVVEAPSVAAGIAPTPAPGPSPTPAPAGAAPPPPPKAIPHSLAGRDNCLACHALGGLKPVPADHQGRTNELCQTCHKAAIELAGPTPTPGAGPPTAVAPAIPHPIAGESNCLTCHAPGGLKPVPANHTGRPTEMCLVCHKPK